MTETNAEQLKRVKRLVEYDIERAFYHDLDLEKGLSLLEKLYEHLDIEWLIEQAEQVQELEERYDGQLEVSQTTYDYFKSEIKRLREALAFYADRGNYNLLPQVEVTHLPEYIHLVDMDEGDIARQAIELEEKEE